MINIFNYFVIQITLIKIYNMTKLSISHEQLGSLESIKNREDLETLYCTYNNLTSLCWCPQNLKELNCSDNQLTTLQLCPTLKELDCHNNKLTTLRWCPQSLKILYCHNNKITSLQGCPPNLKKL